MLQPIHAAMPMWSDQRVEEEAALERTALERASEQGRGFRAEMLMMVFGGEEAGGGKGRGKASQGGCVRWRATLPAAIIK